MRVLRRGGYPPRSDCPRPAMSGAPERVIVARSASVWPIPARGDVRSTASHGNERPNTPFRRTLGYLLARSRGGYSRCGYLKLLQTMAPFKANEVASAV